MSRNKKILSEKFFALAFFHLTPLSHVCYISDMSDQPAVPESVSKPRIVAHRVVVEGLYLSKEPVRGPTGGAAERARKPYKESFDLPVGPERHTHALGALASVLLRELPARILAVDANFRGVVTHHVTSYANVLETPKQVKARAKSSAEQPK